MTLILSLVSDSCAFQVGDRRLVWSGGRVVESEVNKLVLYAGRVAFGYTGLAHLKGATTEQWLMEVLGRRESATLPLALRTLAEEATKAIGGRDSSTYRLAFAGVGWSHEAPGVFRPLLCRVSNFHEKNGETASSPNKRFSVFVRFLRRGERFRYIATGQNVPSSLSDFLKKRIRQYIKGGKSRSLPLTTLVKVVRGTAVKNPSVGLNLLSVCIPKPTGDGGRSNRLLVTTGPPELDHPSFQYWPADLWDGISHGPSVVVPGGVRFSEFRAESYPHSDGTTEPVKLGGMQVTEDKPTAIRYPCCLLFNPLTDCFISAHQEDSIPHLAVFTDEDALEATIAKSREQFVHISANCRHDLARLIRSIRSLEKVVLNPNSPRPHRTFSTSAKSLLQLLGRE
jgi:hypothetical protein